MRFLSKISTCLASSFFCSSVVPLLLHCPHQGDVSESASLPLSHSLAQAYIKYVPSEHQACTKYTHQVSNKHAPSMNKTNTKCVPSMHQAHTTECPTLPTTVHTITCTSACPTAHTTACIKVKVYKHWKSIWIKKLFGGKELKN